MENISVQMKRKLPSDNNEEESQKRICRNASWAQYAEKHRQNVQLQKKRELQLQKRAQDAKAELDKRKREEEEMAMRRRDTDEKKDNQEGGFEWSIPAVGVQVSTPASSESVVAIRESQKKEAELKRQSEGFKFDLEARWKDFD